MKKTILSLILFLAIGVTMNAQYKVTRHAVGTGGFVNRTTAAGKMSGLFGQAIAGKLQPTIDGSQHTMYLGFWSPIPTKTGIEENIILQKGIYNYPNPVSDVTNFNFNLSEASLVTIRVHNSIGVLVATIADNEMRAEGANSIAWNIHDVETLSDGSYSYEMIAVPTTSAKNTKPISFRNKMIISK